MARRRYLSTEVSTDKLVNRLAVEAGDFAALLYTWMIPHAGDDGTVEGDPEELLLVAMPGRRDKEPEDVANALGAMDRIGLIRWDRERGVAHFPESFYKHQSYITEKRRYAANSAQPSENIPSAPEPPHNSAQQRTTAQNSESRQNAPVPPQNRASFSSSFSSSSSLSSSFPEDPSTERLVNPTMPTAEGADASPSADGARTQPNYSIEFEAFWREYPKGRGAKLKTWEAWRKIRAGPETRDAIMAGLARWNGCEMWRDPSLVVYADRWLKERRWGDEPPPPPNPSVNGHRTDGYRDTTARSMDVIRRIAREGS